METSNRKGQLQYMGLLGIVILLLVVLVLAVFMTTTIQGLSTDQTSGSVQRNTTNDALSFLDTISDNWGSLGLVVGLFLMIAIVLSMFKFDRRGI